MGSGKALYRDIRLPGLVVPGNLLLAPLAGYTDAAFRTVCLERGASLAFTEMLSCEALARGQKRTLKMALRAEGERLLAIQLFGSTPESASRAVERLLPLEPAIFDLNCGCSVPKVLRSGCGAALMRDPQLLGRIVRAMVDASPVPVSVKIRSGWDASSINYLDTAQAAVEAGACLVTLHPRTRAQSFTGKAAWAEIGELKSRMPVPVLGSGDLFSAEDACSMLVETGCDGLMFARGAIGNPFIFAAARSLLEGNAPAAVPDSRQRLDAALHHLDVAVATRGEPLACREMRKHMHAYVRGIPGVSRLRQEICKASTRAEYARIFAELVARSTEEPAGAEPEEAGE